MKTRKVISLLCAAAMAVSILPGCQSGKAATSAVSGNSGSADSAASKDAPTLTWWLIGNQPQDLQEGLDKINAYTAPKIGVKVDIKVAGWGDWSDKMNQIVNSGEKFDIMFTNNTKYSRQVNMGAFADITDLVQQKTPDLYKSIPQNVWKGAMIKNKIYAVPTYKDSSITQYWCFDDTYVEKYHIDVANTKTFEALDKALTKIKQGEGKSCYPLNLTQSDAFSGLLNNYDDLTLGLPPIGVRIDDKSHKVVSVLEQPDVKADLEMLHKWYKEGIINPDAPTQKDAVKGRIFFSAQGFPGAEASWAINEGEKKVDTVQAAQPIMTDSSIQGSLNAISANSEHKTEAIEFLQLVNTDQKLRDMLGYGIEGKDFEYVSSKVVKRLTDTWGIGNYAIGSFFDMATQNDAPADQWEQVKKLNEKAVASTCLGFTPDTSDLTTEITNCDASWGKFCFELMTGASDPDTVIPKAIAELKSSGMDKIIKSLQSQLDSQYK
jgi:putative aldouronate transport system substrate-binding protein